MEILETIAGERCPCGHLTENHAEPEPTGVEGFIAKTGACKICPPHDPCNGLIEFEL